jgi:hypothetical protein
MGIVARRRSICTGPAAILVYVNIIQLTLRGVRTYQTFTPLYIITIIISLII